MRIGIDHGPASRHAPGLGRYARELVSALARREGDHALHLLDVGLSRRRVRDLGLASPRCPVVRRRLPMPRRWLEAPGCPGADVLAGGVDLFHHVLLPLVPVSRARQTLCLSEVPPPDTPAAQALGRQLAGLDGVLVFSDAARRDVIAGVGVPAERVHVVPVGSDHWSRERDGEQARDDPPVLLALGHPGASRHPLTVVSAWRQLRERGLRCRLRFVGRAPEPGSTLARVVAEEDDVTHEEGNEAALPGTVARAGVLVHLSDAEATAVTPLEAFAAGVPVVASALPAFEEALDGEALLVDTAAVDEAPGLLADALAEALAGAGGAEATARRRTVAARFTWDACAAATLEAWRRVMAAGP